MFYIHNYKALFQGKIQGLFSGLFDVMFCVFSLLTFLPVILILCVSVILKKEFILSEKVKGLNEKCFTRYFINDTGGYLNRFLIKFKCNFILMVINLIEGNLSVVGPRALRACNIEMSKELFGIRCSVKPGLFSLYELRELSNINYSLEWKTDIEYVGKKGLISDILILFRILFVSFYGVKRITTKENINIMGVDFKNITLSETVKYFEEKMNQSTPHQMCFVNADCINQSFQNLEYKNILTSSDSCFADGIGVKIAGEIMKQSVIQNVNGTDVIPELFRNISHPKNIYLLGASQDVVCKMKVWVQNNFRKINVVGYHHGYFNEEDEALIVSNIKKCKPDLLLVAFGVPYQEMWIARYLDQLNVPLSIGVGGLFDFCTNNVKRAPLWMRELCLEWLFRLIQEPKRLWRRYVVGNVLFLTRIFVYRFKKGLL